MWQLLDLMFDGAKWKLLELLASVITMVLICPIKTPSESVAVIALLVLSSELSP